MNVSKTSHDWRLRLILALIIAVSLAVVMTLVWLSRTPLVHANTTDLSSAEARYTNMVGSRIDTCTLCHTASIPSLNPYGAAYKAAGRNPAALIAVENTDSDGDGFTNVQEILALTFPGNSSDHPAVASPTPTSFQPATSTPTPTNTPVPANTATPTAGPSNTPVSNTPVSNPPTPVSTQENTPTKTPKATEMRPPDEEPTEVGEPTENEPTEVQEPTENEPTEVHHEKEHPTGEPTGEPTESEHHHQGTPNPSRTPGDPTKPAFFRTPRPTMTCPTPTPGHEGDDHEGNPCQNHWHGSGGSGDANSGFFGNILLSLARLFHQ